jgi:hypothetical protein
MNTTKAWTIWASLATVMLACAGCLVGVDPETGERTYSLDANAAGKFEQGAEAGVTVVQGLSALFPALLPVGAAGAGILATWRKIKPKLVEASNERDTYFKAGEALATALEDVKTHSPETWEKIAPVLKTAVSKSATVENAIRGFRGKSA